MTEHAKNFIHGGYRLTYEVDDLGWYDWRLTDGDGIVVGEGLRRDYSLMVDDVELKLGNLRKGSPDRAKELQSIIYAAMRVYDHEHRHGGRLASEFGGKIDGCVACTMALALEKVFPTP